MAKAKKAPAAQAAGSENALYEELKAISKKEDLFKAVMVPGGAQRRVTLSGRDFLARLVAEKILPKNVMIETVRRRGTYPFMEGIYLIVSRQNGDHTEVVPVEIAPALIVRLLGGHEDENISWVEADGTATGKMAKFIHVTLVTHRPMDTLFAHRASGLPFPDHDQR